MRIAVVGVGALGCLLGAQLDAVADVTLIGHWPEQVAAIRRDGLLLEHPEGRPTRHHLTIWTGSERPPDPFDVALFAVKSRQTEAAAAEVAGLLAADGAAITLQNGLNNLSRLREAFGAERAALGVTAEGATVLGPGRVRHAGHGPTHIGLGLVLGEGPRERVEATAALFNAAGFETHLVADTDSLVWGKLAVNAAINPLTALLDVPNGFLAEHPALLDVMGQAAGEVAAVAAAQGIELPFPSAAERAAEVARATAANTSSMLQDVHRGVPTEIDVICGAVVAAGRELGVPVPVNTALLALVQRQERAGGRLVPRADVDGLLELLETELTRQVSQ